MGTPDFAVESLKRLVEGGYNVVGVITMPDKPMGRHGSVLQPSPVKEYAVSQGLRILQPEKLKDEAFYRGTPVFTSRFTNCSCFPYASRNSMEYAAFGHI